MAGTRVELLVSPTDDMGRILNALHAVPVGGECRFGQGLQVAILALKHRREKKGQQRIILFVASPVPDTLAQLTKLGKVLKKNNVAIDIVSFGPIDENQEKLSALVEAANSNGNSHYVSVPQGASPSDVLVSSPVLQGEEGGAAAGYSEFGGVDPSMDPELALALKVSMDEERARQESKNKTEEGAASSTSPDKKVAASTSASSAAAPMDDSMMEDEDAEIQRALQMSMEETKEEEAPPPAPGSASAFLDPSFVNSLLSDLPGVDPNDPKIKAAMAQLQASAKDSEEKKDDKKKE